MIRITKMSEFTPKNGLSQIVIINTINIEKYN